MGEVRMTRYLPLYGKNKEKKEKREKKRKRKVKEEVVIK